MGSTDIQSPAAPLHLRSLAFLAALIPFVWLVMRFDFLTDDAYITFRYARHWAEGHGLVFNPGTSPPVEGYSEFLWAILMGTGLRLGVTPMVLSRVLGVLAGLLLLVGWVRFCSTFVSRRSVALLGAALFLGCLPPLGVWSTGGLATMAFAASVFWLFLVTRSEDVSARAWKMVAIGSLVVLLRADGAWWVAWILGPAFVGALLSRQRERWQPALVGIIGTAAVFGAHVLWRWNTYEDWLPNTARAKVGLSMRAMERGGDYVAHFLVVFPGVVLALLVFLAARRWRERSLLPALVVVLATALHSVLTGGDFMAFGRFLVPALPFVALLLCAGLDGLVDRFNRGLALVVALICSALVLPAALDWDVLPSSWRVALGFRYNTPQSLERSEVGQWERMGEQCAEWIDVGKAFALIGQPGDSLVYGAVGAVGYYSGLMIYDRNGLVTREVAMREPLARATSPGHDKTVPAEFFARYDPTFMDAVWFPGDEAALARYRKNHPGVLQPGLRVQPLDPAGNPRPDQLFLVQRGRK